MKRCCSLVALLTLGLGGLARVPSVAGGDPKGKPNGELIVTDHAGKETKLKTYTFVTGTRRLGWLAPVEGKAVKKGKKLFVPPPAGPEALEFRELRSTTFQNGILTFIPLANIKRIDYDNEKNIVTVTCLRAAEKGSEEEVLTGSTRYLGINKLTIEGETSLGELGLAAVKFLGGIKKGIKSIRFTEPKTVPVPAGRPAVVTARETEKTTHKVYDLQPLYLTSSGQRALPTLLFKTTVKVDVGKLKGLRHAPGEGKGQSNDFEISLKDGAQHTLTLLTQGSIEGMAVELQGLLAKVPAGYKLFPIHTIADVTFDKAEPSKKEDL